MHQPTHHIRILAGFEIVPTQDHRRTLERGHAQSMAEALAADLAKQLPDDGETVLVVGGVILEPDALLQPTFPVYKALEQLAKPLIRDQGLSSSVMAIGSHSSQMPDDRLQPTRHALLGQMVVIPMVVITDEATGPLIERELEAKLFESGSINPPARAALAEYAGLDSVHGQLLTVNDLMALQRVQLDAAGLSGFWDVLETVLIAGDEDHTFDLPGGVTGHWRNQQTRLIIDFLTFDHWARAEADNTSASGHDPSHDLAEGYGLWVRGYRTLLALIDSHNIPWSLSVPDTAVLDERHHSVIEPAHRADGDAHHPPTQGPHLTEHVDPTLGLLAWTLIEEGRSHHLYPTTPEAIEPMRGDFEKRHIQHIDRSNGLCYNEATRTLQSLALKP